MEPSARRAAYGMAGALRRDRGSSSCPACATSTPPPTMSAANVRFSPNGAWLGTDPVESTANDDDRAAERERALRARRPIRTCGSPSRGRWRARTTTTSCRTARRTTMRRRSRSAIPSSAPTTLVEPRPDGRALLQVRRCRVRGRVLQAACRTTSSSSPIRKPIGGVQYQVTQPHNGDSATVARHRDRAFRIS